MAARIKGKLSTSALVLIAVAVIAIIALVVAHFVGAINLTFLADGFLSVLMWAATEVLNGVLFTAGVFIGGALFYYAVKKYLIGTKVPIAHPYMPAGRTVSNPQASEESETVIS